MEKILETSQVLLHETKISQGEELQQPLPSPSSNTTDDSQTPSRECCCKPATTPDRLKVPKAFKFPERYRSPTDLMMSPVSKGLLARNRKPNGLLPPSKTQPKLQSFQLQEAGLFPMLKTCI